jgi:hypothetical protein
VNDRGGGAPSVPLLRSLYAEIIRSMNADVSPTTRSHELEGTATNMLSHASPRMLLIHEIHNLLSCSARDHRAALNAIKYLANNFARLNCCRRDLRSALAGKLFRLSKKSICHSGIAGDEISNHRPRCKG